MKKLLVTSALAGVVLSTSLFGGEAEAAKSNLNYLSSSVVKKAKAGTLTMDGFKIGGKALTYSKSTKYIVRSNRVFETREEYDRAYVDFQNKVSGSKRVVTRIVDKDISDKRTIERNEIIKKFGNPLMTETYNNPANYLFSRTVDVYKNITFFYRWEADDSSTPILDGVVIMHNKTKSAREKWFDYATGEANYMVDEMNEYISSSEWSDL